MQTTTATLPSEQRHKTTGSFMIKRRNGFVVTSGDHAAM